MSLKNAPFGLKLFAALLASMAILFVCIGQFSPPQTESVDAPIPMTEKEFSEFQEFLKREISETPINAELMPDSELSEMVPEVVPGAVGEPERRSGKWPKVRDTYFAAHPHCEFKGCKSKGPFNVHHVEPFHLNKSKELDPHNLITLCVGEENHHLYVGHQGDFKDVNSNVREDCRLGRFPQKGLVMKSAHDAKLQKQKSKSPSKTTIAP